MGCNPNDVYKYMSIIDVVCYSLNDNNIKCIRNNDGLILIKDYLPNGTPVWRLPEKGEHLEDEV